MEDRLDQQADVTVVDASDGLADAGSGLNQGRGLLPLPGQLRHLICGDGLHQPVQEKAIREWAKSVGHKIVRWKREEGSR